MNAGPLSPRELDDVRRDGFLVARGLFGRDEIAEVGRWIDELALSPPVAGKQMVYFEDSLLDGSQRVISRIEKFLDDHPPWLAFVSDARLTSRVEQLLGEPGVLFKEKINFKCPGGNGFKPHQDIQPGWDDYTDYFLSVLVTIDDSTIENGCLELAAGQHDAAGSAGGDIHSRDRNWLGWSSSNSRCSRETWHFSTALCPTSRSRT